MTAAPPARPLGALIDSPIPLILSFMGGAPEEGAHLTEAAKVTRELVTLHLYRNAARFEATKPMPFSEPLFLSQQEIEAMGIGPDGTSPTYRDSYFELIAKVNSLFLMKREPLLKIERFKLSLPRLPEDSLYFALMHFGMKLPQVPIHCVESVGSDMGGGKEAQVYAMGEQQVVKLYHPAHLSGWELCRKSFQDALQCVDSAASVSPHPAINRLEGLVFVLGRGQWGAVFAKIPGQSLRLSMPTLSEGERVDVALTVARGLQHLALMRLPHVDLAIDNIMLTTQPRGVTLIDYARRECRAPEFLAKLQSRSKSGFGRLLFTLEIHRALATRCQFYVDAPTWDRIITDLSLPPQPAPPPRRKHKAKVEPEDSD